MRMEAPVHEDIVANDPVHAFTQLEGARQLEVLFDDVIRGAVVQINIPAVVALEAVAPHHNWFDRVQRGQGRLHCQSPIHFRAIWMPVAVASVSSNARFSIRMFCTGARRPSMHMDTPQRPPCRAMQHGASRIAPGRHALLRRGATGQGAQDQLGGVAVGIARTDQHRRAKPQALEVLVLECGTPDAAVPGLPV
ncbi:hypothetical protein ASC93_21765 [Massilia sp. Root335]|nr:hypothetical protein ASC93_21765 [Massilia sp. Root335]